MLRVAASAGYMPLFAVAAGIATSSKGPSELSALVYIDGPRRMLVGEELRNALLNLDARAVPDLRDLTPEEMQLVRINAAAARVPLDEQARYAFVPTGVRLGNTGADPVLPVGLVIRQSLDRTAVWSTTADLRRSNVRAEAVIAAELQTRTQERPEISGFIRRYFTDYHVHAMQPSASETRVALRTVTMLANLAVVGVNRALQVTRPPI